MYITDYIKPGISDRKLLQKDVGGCKIAYGISLGRGDFPEHKSLDIEKYIRRFNGEAHTSVLRERHEWAISQGCFAYAPCILSPMLSLSYHDIVIEDNGAGMLENGEYTVCFIEGSLSHGEGELYLSHLLAGRDSVSSAELFGAGGGIRSGWYAGAWGNSSDCIMLCMSKKGIKFLYDICSKLKSGMLAVIPSSGSLYLVCLDKYIRFVMK